MGVAIAAVLSEVDSVFTLKECQKTTLRAFLSGHVFTLLLTGFGKHSSVLPIRNKSAKSKIQKRREGESLPLGCQRCV